MRRALTLVNARRFTWDVYNWLEHDGERIADRVIVAVDVDAVQPDFMAVAVQVERGVVAAAAACAPVETAIIMPSEPTSARISFFMSGTSCCCSTATVLWSRQHHEAWKTRVS